MGSCFSEPQSPSSASVITVTYPENATPAYATATATAPQALPLNYSYYACTGPAYYRPTPYALPVTPSPYAYTMPSPLPTYPLPSAPNLNQVQLQSSPAVTYYSPSHNPTAVV